MRPLMQAAAMVPRPAGSRPGRIDLVDDLAGPVPAVLTMALVGLPLDDWRTTPTCSTAPSPTGRATRVRPGDRQGPAMLARLGRGGRGPPDDPSDDLLSALVRWRRRPAAHGRRGAERPVEPGRRRTRHDDVADRADAPPPRRHRPTAPPVAEPACSTSATEEFLRYFSVNETLTRTVARDTELGGQHLGRGDHLMLSWLSANRDRSVFDARRGRARPVDQPAPGLRRRAPTAASGCTWPGSCSRSCWARS